MFRNKLFFIGSLWSLISFSEPLQKKSYEFFFFQPDSKPSLSNHYKSITQELQKQHSNLKVKFVLGESNPNFIKIDSDLWDKTGKYERFSKTDALGRMLCPFQGVNQSPNFLILVRADDTGETFFHEYLHFLQSQRDPSVCETYKKMETSSSAELLTKNSSLEYEVHRLIYENSKSLNLDSPAMASVLEKLGRYQVESGQTAKAVDSKYQWQELDKNFLNLEIQKIVTLFSKSLEKLENYEPSIPELKFFLSEGPASVKNGIGVLREPPLQSLSTFCLKNDKAWNPEILNKAIENWNGGAKTIGYSKPVFKQKCDSLPEVKIEVDNKSGSMGDGIVKLGGVFQTQDPNKQVLLIRTLEFKSQENLLKALVQKEIFKNPSKAKELNSFLDKKLKETKLHFLMHELGHTLGLAHNFNEAEDSIMNYSDQTSLSAYDLDALRFLTKGPTAVNKTWSPQVIPQSK